MYKILQTVGSIFLFQLNTQPKELNCILFIVIIIISKDDAITYLN